MKTFDTSAEKTDVLFRLWWKDASDPITDDVLKTYFDLLSPDERNRANKFRNADTAQEYIIAHALLRKALAYEAGIDPRAWLFSTDARGMPSIENKPYCDWLSFSLTHTSGFVACVTAHRRCIGVDAEPTTRGFELATIAKQFLSRQEYLTFNGLQKHKRDHYLVRLWTLKEAYSKAMGQGLAMSFPSLAFDLSSDLEKAYINTAGSLDWNFQLIAPFPNYLIAVAVENKHSGQIFEINPVELLPSAQ